MVKEMKKSGGADREDDGDGGDDLAMMAGDRDGR